MYTIKFQPEQKNYRFEKNNSAVVLEGNIFQVTDFAVYQGISRSELTLAYTVMEKQLNTHAEFDILGKFLFSHNGRPANIGTMYH